MKFDRRLLNWGLFFVILGAVPLAVRVDLVPAETAGRAWTLWPILLIAAGVGILLRRTGAAAVGGLIGALTFGLIGGGLLAGGTVPIGNCTDDPGTAAIPARDGTLGSLASVDIRMTCGELVVRTQDGDGWRLSGTARTGDDPEVSASSSELRIEDRRTDPFSGLDGGQRWEVDLPRTPRLDLGLRMNAGQLDLDLRGATLAALDLQVNAGQAVADLSRVTELGQLDVSVNAGSARVALPGRSLTGSLDVNAGEIRVCAPAGAGLRFIGEPGLTAAYDFPGLTQTAGAWESAGFASASIRIELRVDANAGRLALDPAGGCGG